MKKTKAAIKKAGRTRPATKDLAARRSGRVKAGAVQPSYQVLPYIEQRVGVTGGSASGRIGSIAQDPADPR